MVFENLTLFELNFDDAPFGFGENDGSETVDEVEAVEGTAGGRRRYLPLLVGVGLVAVAVTARRYWGHEIEADLEVEAADAAAPEPVE